ncbi:tRNA (guanine(26)-N(2))-dimethyltransferase isoform X1 [Lepeophtheirus salmonis]|uniref:tRNA (guanine(26)-N(2))-dimethyltransferase isoform X1 n=2 Tax=Lepeophtheirus salmonis TaxID=72036 RepID=UPI001AE6AC8E|nr:probable tRNA (guanine(26)-N(2))-dimethyltransferase isoform X1 [Lepeophtheirus salmonis]
MIIPHLLLRGRSAISFISVRLNSRMVSDVENGETVVQEGKAVLGVMGNHGVFYNPVQQFNRDISIHVIQSYINEKLGLGPIEDVLEKRGIKREADGIQILEALSASGLRSIRYAKELAGIKKITANDWSQAAVACITKNAISNGVDDIITPSQGDATAVMYANKKTKFDVVDLDPYGSPTPFLDSAVQCLSDGGLLCVTCTDMAVLCGNAADSCRAKYGSISLRSKGCHEMALRIVLNSIETHANRYGRYIEPLLSLSVDFYVRLFVRVRVGQNLAKSSIAKVGNVFVCTGCESFHTIRSGSYVSGPGSKLKLTHGPPVGKECNYCGHSHVMGGPFWLDPIHNRSFVSDLISSLKNDMAKDRYGTYKRMLGILSVVEEELPDVPLYYIHDRLSSLVRAGSGKINEIRSAILNGGFRVSQSHCHRLAIKTDAPSDFIWDMMRAWKHKYPTSKETKEPVAIAILSKESSNKISFEMHPNANPVSREAQLVRFQINPEKNWGPKMKSTTSICPDEENEKRKRNQGKYTKNKRKKLEEPTTTTTNE